MVTSARRVPVRVARACPGPGSRDDDAVDAVDVADRPGKEAQSLRWRVEGSDPQVSLFPGLFDREFGTGEFRGMEFLHVRAKSIINRVPDEARLPFRHTLNAYRGCSHACSYCFARPSHAYLGLGTGEDFDRRIVVKTNTVELLRSELSHPVWAGETIALGTNTDPYQRCEGRYRLTRGVIEALVEHSNPFTVLTKSTLVLRDVDLLADAARKGLVRCNMSMGTVDSEVYRITEPGAPHPDRRLEVVRSLNDAGVPCGVVVAPVLPGLSDGVLQLEDVARRAADAGAVGLECVPLHLRPGVREHFLSWLETERPDLVPRYRSIYRRSAYGPVWQRRVLDRFEVVLDRLGLGHLWHRGDDPDDGRAADAPPPPDAAQLSFPGLG